MPSPIDPELAHVYPGGAEADGDGHLILGGCDAVALAREFGTPLYVVVEPDLRARARAYRDGLSERHADSAVLFASKAFPCSAVLRMLAEEGLGCDVASGGELALALRAGFAPDRVHLHGNAKTVQELTQAVSTGVGHVVLDSFDDIERLEAVAGALGKRQKVLLRVTPNVSGDTHAAISTGQADSKFGFGLDQAPAALERLAACDHLLPVGVHCHIGSQLLELEPFGRAVAAIAGLPLPLSVVNLGGGLGVAYRRDQRPPAIGAYLDAVVGAVHSHLGERVRLLLEPGRAIVANPVVTLYTVQTVKRNVSWWVAVDGGMSDNLRPMLYGACYEAQMAERINVTGGRRCRLAGKHCESGDVIVQDAVLADPRPGDLVVTPATGAYGYAMANNYNGALRPAVVLVGDGQARLAVRRETPEDLMARDLDPWGGRG
jgi:diaminopimelate decarboxylase